MNDNHECVVIRGFFPDIRKKEVQDGLTDATEKFVLEIVNIQSSILLSYMDIIRAYQKLVRVIYENDGAENG